MDLVMDLVVEATMGITAVKGPGPAVGMTEVLTIVTVTDTTTARMESDILQMGKATLKTETGITGMEMQLMRSHVIGGTRASGTNRPEADRRMINQTMLNEIMNPIRLLERERNTKIRRAQLFLQNTKSPHSPCSVRRVVMLRSVCRMRRMRQR